MNRYLQAVTTYVTTHRNEAVTTAVVAVVFIFVVALFIYDSTPHYVYQPVKACDLLTPAEAQDMLGDKVLSTDANTPVVSDDTATSKCSYSDENPDKSKMMVAAVAVRSAIDDKGAQQNKVDFATARANNDVEIVKNVGDSAYFNKTSGQLNVLSGHMWLILNYGVGSTPQTNTVDKAVELAHKVL